jgi:hypothetical protein
MVSYTAPSILYGVFACHWEEGHDDAISFSVGQAPCKALQQTGDTSDTPIEIASGPGALAMKVRMRITLTTQTDITLSNPYKITGGTAGQARSATQEKILIHSSSHAKRRNF